jgi:hypothetical protein
VSISVSGCSSNNSWRPNCPITTDHRGDPQSHPTAPQPPVRLRTPVSAWGLTRLPSPHRTPSLTRCPWLFTAPFHHPDSRDIGLHTRPTDVGDCRNLDSSWPKRFGHLERVYQLEQDTCVREKCKCVLWSNFFLFFFYEALEITSTMKTVYWMCVDWNELR